MKMMSWNRELLDGVLHLWNRELGKAFPMRKELLEQNSFEAINICWDSSLAVLDDAEHVIGFIIVKCYQDQLDMDMPVRTGWIQALVVDSRFQNQGIGTRLLEHAESKLKDKGMETVLLGRDPKHYFPGVPHVCERAAVWFASRGYEKQGTDYDLARSYDSSESITYPAIGGVSFDVLDENEKSELMQFLHRCFPGRWEYEAATYFQDGGSGREFVVLKKDDRIIGFCRINDADSPVIAQNVYWAPLFQEALGGIGPLGVDAAERGHGYGLAIVEAGIAVLRNRGVKHIVIDWTGLIDFYQKLGYHIWKSYDAYRKVL